MSNFEGRGQVENEIGRLLTQDELLGVDTISQLTSAHLAVLQILVRRQRLAALLYLQAILPDLLTRELNELINRYG